MGWLWIAAIVWLLWTTHTIREALRAAGTAGVPDPVDDRTGQ